MIYIFIKFKNSRRQSTEKKQRQVKTASLDKTCVTYQFWKTFIHMDVRFKALWGAEENEPLCFLLELDDFTLLLDCGWTTQFNVQLLEPLKK